MKTHLSIPSVALALLLSSVAVEAGGIPTATGVDHVGVTVPNLRQGIDFFVNALGCEQIYTAGPFADPNGTWMQTNLNVDPKAATTLSIVRCGPTQNVELFEYSAPGQVTAAPKNSDVGGNHIAFYVTDINAAVAYLKGVPGVTVLGEPTPVSGQPNGGETFVYFLTPWGSSMEVLSYNGGLDYKKTTDKRMYELPTQ